MAKTNKLRPLIVGIGLLALVLKAFAGRGGSSKPAPRLPSDGVPIDRIDSFIQSQMKRLNIPGAALAVVEGDQIIHMRGFGKAHPNGGDPLPQTPFFIGSLTKSFTALAVMQLVEAGKVALDTPIQQYLPWFRVADPRASAMITVRHLLNQTSGMPVVPGELLLANFDSRPDATERQVRDLSNLKLSHPVGEVCEYSNLNYNILGLIVEAASGMPYAAYLQTRIFEPLEMGHSYTSRAEAQKHGLAMGHRHWFSIPVPAPNMPIPLGSLPSGQLISSAEDMAHYLIAHLNEGRRGSAQVLSAAGIAELHRGVKEYIALGVSLGKYGMGWLDANPGQTRAISHSGNVPDFSAHMAILPQQKRGFVLLFNADPYGLPPITGEIGTGVTLLLAGQDPPPIRLDFIKWIMRLLPLIPLLQAAGAIALLRKARRWRKQPAERRLTRGKHILLPLIPTLAPAAILAYLRSSGLMKALNLFMPDLALTARISGIFGGVWALLRTALVRQSFSRQSPHDLAGE